MTIQDEQYQILVYLYNNTKSRFEAVDREKFEKDLNITFNSPSYGSLKEHGLTETTKTSVTLSDAGRLFCEQNNLIMGLNSPTKQQNINNHLTFNDKLDLVFKHLFDEYGEPAWPLTSVTDKCGFTSDSSEFKRLNAEIELSGLVVNDKRPHHYGNWFKLDSTGFKALYPFGGKYSKYLEALKQQEEENEYSSRQIQKANSVSIGVNYGVVSQDSDFRESRPVIKPNITQIDPLKTTTGNTSLLKNVVKEAWIIVATIIATVVGGYILFRMGWIG